jgi:hypothetical protein
LALIARSGPAVIRMASRSQKRLRSSSGGILGRSERTKFTVVEFTPAPDRLPLSIQPKMEGISTEDSEIRIGGLSCTIFRYESPPMRISTGKSFIECLGVGQQYFSTMCQSSDFLRDSWLRRYRVRALKGAHWDSAI